jgi:hypothetical protein
MEIVTSSIFSPGEGPATVFADQVLIAPRAGLLVVADAPGGSEHGRAAVRMAIDTVRAHVERHDDILDRFRRNPTPDLRKRVLTTIEEAFARAAQEVFAFARRREGVSVTMDVCLLLGSEAFIGHVGDGRVYLVRRGLVHQLTVDHGRLADADVFSDAANAPRALGPEPHVRVESLCMELAPEDRFVVSTSHLHRTLPESILHARLTGEPLEGLGQALKGDASTAPLLGACAQLGSGEPFTPDSARSRLAILAPMPLFAHCTEKELRAVAQATRPRTLSAGTVLFEQGQPGTELFLVISGAIDIVKGERTIVTLGPGSTFGEMAMLDEPHRSATARIARDAELMVIPRDAFFAMLKGNPMLAVKVLWNMLLRLSSNLRTTSARLAELEKKLLE